MKSAATLYRGMTEMLAQDLPELRIGNIIALINPTLRSLHLTFHVSGCLPK